MLHHLLISILFRSAAAARRPLKNGASKSALIQIIHERNKNWKKLYTNFYSRFAF